MVKVTKWENIENVTVNSVNSANFVDLSAMDVTALTATGDSDLTVTKVKNGITSVDASALEGNLTIDTTDISDAGSLKEIKSGAGDDTFTVDAADLLAIGNIDGGDGDDNLILSDSDGTTLQLTMAGVETLTLANSKELTFSTTNTSDLNTVVIGAEQGADASIVNLGSADIKVNTLGATDTTTRTTTLDNAGSTIIDLMASEETIADAGTDKQYSTINLTQSNSITITSKDNVEFTGSIKADTASDVSLTVDANSTFNGNLHASEALSLVIDSKGSTQLASNSDLNAVQTVSITSDGSVDLGENSVTLNDAADVTLAGAGSIKLDDIDTSNKDHDVLIDASELGGGLIIGGIKSDQKVDLDVKDV